MAERDVIYEEYRHRINEIISGTVKRIVRGATLIVDLGKVEGVLPDRFYPKTEQYNVGDRVQALLYEVKDTDSGGAEVILSRSHPAFVEQLFELEIPELKDGIVSIERIVRDAGYRTKVAVRSSDLKVDPVGACVGVRGSRVKNIIRELNNEKIDIIPYTDDPIALLRNSLAPVQPKKISLSDDERVVTIVVEDELYPTILGKRGMNARLNGELIGLEVQVQKASEYGAAADIEREKIAQLEDPSLDEELSLEGVSPLIVHSLTGAGYDTPRKILSAPLKDLISIPGISTEMVDTIVEQICKKRI
jgi:N utilization substance protein A